jgi:hypothetical protein
VFGYVYLRIFVEEIVVGVYGMNTLADFDLRTFFICFLLLIGWEILLIVLPTLGFLGLMVGIYWWKFMSNYEKKDIKEKLVKFDEEGEDIHVESRKRFWGPGTTGVSCLGLLINLAIKGMWRIPVASYDTIQITDIWLEALFWIVIIFGIPAFIIFLVWFMIKEQVISGIIMRVQKTVDDAIGELDKELGEMDD